MEKFKFKNSHYDSIEILEKYKKMIYLSNVGVKFADKYGTLLRIV